MSGSPFDDRSSRLRELIAVYWPRRHNTLFGASNVRYFLRELRRLEGSRFESAGCPPGAPEEPLERQGPVASAHPGTSHPAGCTYGGFSCGYWLIVEGCPHYHPETHIVTDDRCPCGHTFPGAGTCKVVSDARDQPLPVELQKGLGTPIELEMAGCE